MDFEDNELTFQEVDRRYGDLVRQREEGAIGEEEFDAQRQRLMVRDEEGRWWAKSRQSGEWKYYDSGAWVTGTPPSYEPPQTAYEEPSGEPSGESEPEPAEETGPEPAEERREPEETYEGPVRRLRAFSVRTALLAVFLLLILLAAAAYTIAGGTREDILVPELVGIPSVEEAREKAGEDFEVVEEGALESREPAGTIVEQDPSAGELAGEGSTISVSVSTGASAPDPPDAGTGGGGQPPESPSDPSTPPEDQY